MTDQQLNCETNQDKDGMPEESIQPRMGAQGPENPAQPPMGAQGPENPTQPPMTYQDLENPVQPQMSDQGPENPAQPPMAEQAPENSTQPPMTYQDLENPVQPQMSDQGPENPAQPPMADQGPENSVPNRGLLTLVFFVNMGLLMLFIGSAVIAGPWGIVFLIFLGSYLTCYIAATVLLGIGTKTANKTMLFVSVTLYFASMLFAGDPAWLGIQIPSIISTILVLIGTLLL
ncbi:SSP-5 [Streptococcus australis]|uniref:Uncharacterized protein n=1 Tax=Streptococcus australis ATCC 700641 TaxID=888833 RepID=E7SAD2_9STRE|nr:hypothetical protein [Streptococcus australis]EFV99041.1 hypothetical protein HMPREF9421_1149 [Streptococcus australis ATCC 700641]EGU62312.1 conserved domain protein [Streptococcus australis ATCC 700641]SQH66652.1 SSP-5 [Streptococcus australis]